jgi:hypothetical protein
VNHVNSHAHQEVWAANDDIVAKVQWVSTLDQATTPICRGRDGETYPVNSGPRPPAHIGCRSTTVPVLKPWDELGLKDPGPRTRASLDGGAPGDMNYQDWLKRMDGKRPGFVRHILGAKRYALWKKGGLSVKQFVNLRTGQEYNLAYLKKAHPEAWKKAFPVGNVKRPPVPKFKGASRPVVTNPKAEMAAWVAQQKKLKAAQKSGAVPKVFNTTEAGITHDRMLGLLEKVPGAVAGARLVRDFISRFQTGSVFGLQSHLTPAGLRKRAAAGNAYLRSLGKPPIEHPSNYTLADLGEWDANVLGWTGRVWNTVMVKIPQDFTNFSKVKPEGLAEVVDGAIKLADIGKKQWSFSKIAQLATTTGDESPKLLTWLHEMGHQVHYRAGRPQFSGYKQATLTRYGAYTHMEFAAEHFVAWVLNRAALQKARPEIVKWLDDMVAKALKPEN